MTGCYTRLGCFVAMAGLFAAAGSASRATNVASGKPHQPWKTGYWVWAGESPAQAGFMPDILYVETPPRRWPRGLPPAYEYVAVRRMETDLPLTPAVAAAVVDDYKALVADAGPRVPITGLQIDYDSPARLLDAYGVFLAQLRQRLPPSDRLSITALLDWFRPYAGIDRVLHAVDEFVPQFYDTAHKRTSAGIAEPIESVAMGAGLQCLSRPLPHRRRDVRSHRQAAPRQLGRAGGSLLPRREPDRLRRPSTARPACAQYAGWRAGGSLRCSGSNPRPAGTARGRCGGDHVSHACVSAGGVRSCPPVRRVLRGNPRVPLAGSIGNAGDRSRRCGAHGNGHGINECPDTRDSRGEVRRTHLPGPLPGCEGTGGDR